MCLHYILKLRLKDRNIMNTTNDKEEKVEWEKLGQEGKKPPEITELLKLMIDGNNQQKKILEETKKWLQQNGNRSR